jgi:hypothetical protein
LKVCGVSAARVWLRMGNASVLSFLREDIERGINLANQWSLGLLQTAMNVHRFTCEKDQIYHKIWRSLSLNNVKGGPQYPGAHAIGIRMSPGLERVRKGLLAGGALSCSMELVSTDRIGMPIGNGDFIGRWSCMGPFPKPYETDRLDGEAALILRVA